MVCMGILFFEAKAPEMCRKILHFFERFFCIIIKEGFL